MAASFAARSKAAHLFNGRCLLSPAADMAPLGPAPRWARKRTSRPSFPAIRRVGLALCTDRLCPEMLHRKRDQPHPSVRRPLGGRFGRACGMPSATTVQGPRRSACLGVIVGKPHALRSQLVEIRGSPRNHEHQSELSDWYARAVRCRDSGRAGNMMP
jgi:hypothetical protein